MNDGRGFVMGNLVRDWERKEVNVKGTNKILWKNCVAHQPHKNDDTVFVEITIWPFEQDDTLGRTVADTVNKGKPGSLRTVRCRSASTTARTALVSSSGR